MIRIVYFDYDNERCRPDVSNNIDKCNCTSFFVVFVKMSIRLKAYHPYRKIHTISWTVKKEMYTFIRKYRTIKVWSARHVLMKW